MKAAEIARIFNARKVGRGKWIAKCTGHDDKKPSLSIAEGRRVPVVLKCQSHHCDVRDILKAAGLTWDALFDGKPTPEIRRRVSLQERRESLERQLGLVIMLQAVERAKRRYWAAVERRIRRELFWVRWELEPEKIEQEILKWHKERICRLPVNSTPSTGHRRSSATAPTRCIT